MSAKNYELRLRVSDAELDTRVARVVQAMAEKDAKAAIFFNTTSIFYLSHFYFIATERPIARIVTWARRPPCSCRGSRSTGSICRGGRILTGELGLTS